MEDDLEDVMDAIIQMIDVGMDNGMLPELIRSFHDLASNGHSIIDSCEIALSEWDL